MHEYIMPMYKLLKNKKFNKKWVFNYLKFKNNELQNLSSKSA